MPATATLKLSDMASTKSQSPSTEQSAPKALEKKVKTPKGFSLQDINIGASSTCLGMAKTTQKPCKHNIPKERRDAAKVLEKELLLAAAITHAKKQPEKEEQAEDEFVVVEDELGSLLKSMARISLCHHHKQQFRNVVDEWTKGIELQQPVDEAQVPKVPGKDLAVLKEEEVKDGEEAKPQVKIEEPVADSKP